MPPLMSAETPSTRPYTRETMDIGTLGDRRQLGFDAIYAEAKESLSRSANELRALTDQLRQEFGEALRERDEGRSDAQTLGGARQGDSRELVRGRQMLSRLEVTTRELERSWLFLERAGHAGGDDEGSATELSADHADGVPVAMRILEAQEAERRRLADELHDGPAQTLANAAFQVEIIDRQLRSDPVAARAEVQDLRGRLERELDQLRGYINHLRPPIVDEVGLEAALRDTAERLTSPGEVPVELEISPPPATLDTAQRMAVLRVAQEALRNVRKHAGATRVRLFTGPRPAPDGSGEAWVLEVTDDGAGFEPGDVVARTARRHFGLRFMRERAELIGARLDIVSADGAGTTVRLVLDTGERRTG
jgi:two-component system, NarL family, sensor histidine kinase DegS